MEKLRRALDKENQKAVKHAQEKPQLSLGNPLAGSTNTAAANAGPKLNLGGGGPTGVVGGGASNLDSFAKSKGLIIGERVDHVAANQQLVRAEELRELVDLGHEEFFNMFEMVPQTPQDVYFAKLAAGTVKTAIVSSSDDYIDKDV